LNGAEQNNLSEDRGDLREATEDWFRFFVGETLESVLRCPGTAWNSTTHGCLLHRRYRVQLL